jgi:hypothetical protein
MMMRNLIATTVLVGLAGASMGCSFHARGPDKYRDDVRALLEKNSASLKSCYDGVRKGDEAAAGTVTVNFVVQKETGKIAKVAVDAANSTAPQGVQDCLSQSLDGLALDPVDARDGHATFTYEFEVAPGAAPAPAAKAEAKPAS